MTAYTILIHVRPCKKCGATDRSASGRCNPCNRARASAWYAANTERAIANGNAYRAANPEKHKAAVKAVVAANTEKKRLDDSAWNAKNRDRVKDRKAAWYAANPDAGLRHTHNRRARKLSVGGKLSKGLAKKLYDLQRGKCACCGVSIAEGYHLDHRMPLALDGPNTDDNIQLLCVTCNLSKGAKHPVDFMQQRGLLL